MGCTGVPFHGAVVYSFPYTEDRSLKRRMRAPFWIPLLFGLLGLSRVVGNPHLATIRGVDIVQLLATGMCLGVALSMMITFFKRPGS